MPNIDGQRWSCHSCGNCCRTLVVHLTRRERERLDQQEWEAKLGVSPYVRVGRGWALNKRDNGACVFLDEENRCKIHAEYGEGDKPVACRLYPFSVCAVPDGWQASVRFDCPSVVSSKGRPVSQYRTFLLDLVQGLTHAPPQDRGGPHLQRGLRATEHEVDALTSRFVRWLASDDLPLAYRLIGAARLTATLNDASLSKVRGARFSELLDLLFSALPTECAGVPPPPTARQLGMLRQLAFAHAEHVTLREHRGGVGVRLRKRWRQLRAARRFRKGRGVVPRLPGLEGDRTFERVESVRSACDRAVDVEHLLVRYLTARFEGRSVFGTGYYGWPVIGGLGALWLSVAVAGWVARCAAAGEGRTLCRFDDVACAIGVVDRAATRLPALGTMAERARLSYLFTADGVARLLHAYSSASEAR